MPFILYFVSGLVPWLFLNEVLTGGINAVTSNAQLVKKTVFPAEILPLVNLASATFTHLLLFGSLCFLAWQYGYGPSLITIQVLYFYAALACFEPWRCLCEGPLHGCQLDRAGGGLLTPSEAGEQCFESRPPVDEGTGEELFPSLGQEVEGAQESRCSLGEHPHPRLGRV